MAKKHQANATAARLAAVTNVTAKSTKRFFSSFKTLLQNTLIRYVCEIDLYCEYKAVECGASSLRPPWCSQVTVGPFFLYS